MKLLENTVFEALSSSLSVENNDGSRIITRIESYSCKMAGDCKRLYKQMHDEKSGTSPYDLQLLGPPATLDISPGTSSPNLHTYMQSRSINEETMTANTAVNNTNSMDLFSQLNNSIIHNKMLFYLRSTLNASFHPDYDFTETPSSEFSKEPSLDKVVKNVESHLNLLEAYSNNRLRLWQAIDREIVLAECEFYSYNPDLESDPCAENGSLWFFNFFFYNKKLRRIVFFTCRCKKIDDEDEEDEEEEDVDQRLDDDYYGSFMRSDSSSNAPNVTTLSTVAAVNGVAVTGSKPISTLIGFMDQ